MDPNVNASNADEVSSITSSDSSKSSDSLESEVESVSEIKIPSTPVEGNRFIEDYGLYEPFTWRTGPSTPVAISTPDNDTHSVITHAISPKSNREQGDCDDWLVGGPIGSRNTTLVFRSSALANPTDISIQSKPAYKLHITYKVSQAETKLLAKLLDCHGVMEVANNSSDFNLLWTGSHPKPGTLRSLASHQRVNHFPRSYELTRKDRLYKNIERMQHARGLKHFDFIPQTFVMPADFRELCSIHYRIKGPWIVKPVASSRGRGIFIVENPSQVPLDEQVVVAKYINRPLLVEGHKCDLRLYVLVTSFDPLLVYIYEEGLVRFATVRYDPSHKQLWNPCMHLCNYSINKYHSDYVKSDDPSAENVGHKWTLSALLRHLKAQGKDTALLMTQVEDVVVKALLSSASSIVPACQMFVPNMSNCFELYGFDILIDENLKPWLLEVNLSPSLGCDSPLDVRLKSAMLADLLTLVGIPAVDPILRLSNASVAASSNSSVKNNSYTLKMKLSNCQRVYSADGLNSTTSSNTLPKKSNTATHGNRLTQSTFTLSSEEQKLVRMTKMQFERRGGFVRIFPTVESWSKYSQYLDPVTGVPTCGALSSSYNFIVAHNYNHMLFTQLFPDVPINTMKFSEKAVTMDHRKLSSERRADLSVDTVVLPKNRQDRYERMLSRGHKTALSPKKIPLKESHSKELSTQMIEMIKNGKRLTQVEARKTFSQYLSCVLKRIVSSPEQEGHVEIVLKFLQKASTYLRTPFSVKVPSHKLLGKDRAAIVAKQLNDFLYLYNRETEMFGDILDRPSHLPNKLFMEFLEHARECDLEEVLMLQSVQTVPSKSDKKGFQGILKCLPSIGNASCFKTPMPQTGRSAVRVSHLS